MEIAAPSRSLQQSLAAAVRDHQQGNLKAAEAGYRAVLAFAPENPYALNLLGLLEYQNGRLEPARGLAARAIALHPGEAKFHMNLGNILRTGGRGREAIAALRAGLHSCSESADLAMNLGVALTEAGESAEALAVLRRAVALGAADAEAHYNLGNALASEGAHAESAQAFRRAADLRPSFTQAWYNLGNALSAAALLREAAGAFRRTVELDARFAKAWFNLGNVEARLNHAASAADAYRRTLELDPQNAKVCCALGQALLQTNDPAAASESFRNALSIDPLSADAYLGLGLVMQKSLQLKDSVICLDRALAFAPELVEAHEAKAGSLWQQGNLAQAVASFDRAAALAPDNPRAASNCAFVRTYLDHYGPGGLLDVHREYARCLAAGADRQIPAPAPGRALLRVGFVSADLRRHSVAYFLEPVLRELHAGYLQIWCYFNHRKADEVTARLKALAHGWRDCAGLSEDELAQAIAGDGIDILIDLSGHTAGNRLGMFHRRPAPVQATWLGYPTTTALEAFDYRITDALVDPDDAQVPGAERPLRLPGSYFCYGAPDPGAQPAARAAPPGEGPVFGSFNNLAKLSPATLSLWKDLLDAVPTGRLLLKSKALADPATREDLSQRLQAAGIGAHRQTLEPWREDTAAHLAAYNGIDVALDTLAYNGATTTCEALWMGVPVVTLPGATQQSRMGKSILTAAGLAEWIARDRADYLRIAAGLARESVRPAPARAALRDRVRASRLMDAPRFARDLAAGFERMWDERAGR